MLSQNFHNQLVIIILFSFLPIKKKKYIYILFFYNACIIKHIPKRVKYVRNFFVSNKYFFLSLPLDYFIGLQHEKVEQKLSYLCIRCVILIIYSWLPTNEFIIYPSLLVRYTLARLLKSAKWFCVILIPWNGQYEHKHIQDNCVFNLRKDKIIRI